MAAEIAGHQRERERWAGVPPDIGLRDTSHLALKTAFKEQMGVLSRLQSQ
jgi:hypothetical protein